MKRMKVGRVLPGDRKKFLWQRSVELQSSRSRQAESQKARGRCHVHHKTGYPKVVLATLFLQTFIYSQEVT